MTFKSKRRRQKPIQTEGKGLSPDEMEELGAAVAGTMYRQLREGFERLGIPRWAASGPLLRELERQEAELQRMLDDPNTPPALREMAENEMRIRREDGLLQC